MLFVARTAVRLVNGRHPSEDRVEVYHKGKWGTVCGNGFHKNDATVICKMIGYQDKYNIMYYYIDRCDFWGFIREVNSCISYVRYRFFPADTTFAQL
jgi:hypothetical protein